MANESVHKVLWRLSDYEPSQQLADKRGINYHADPVDEFPLTRDQANALARQYMDFINRHDLDGAMTLLDDQMADRTLPGEPVTKEGVRMQYMPLFNAFPDLNVTATKILVDGDMFVINGEFHGTSQAEFFGTPATGKSFSTYMIEIFKVREGKFVERYFWYDAMKIVRTISG